MRKIFVFMQYPRMIFADILYIRSGKFDVNNKTIKALIDEDVLRYLPKKEREKKKEIYNLNYCLINKKVFRSVFYFRISQSQKLQNSLFRILSKMLVKPLDNIEIGINKTRFIDGGLFIEHASGCVVSPLSAGSDLTVYQGVTIGARPRKDINEKDEDVLPVIGDRVTIMPNAVVAGGITIGNDVVIGAGSVVLKSVPEKCVVAGNPAKVIREDGIKKC